MELQELFNQINQIQSKYDPKRTVAFNNFDKFKDIYQNMIVPVFNYLESQGYSREQIAGIMGNILQESKFDHSLRGGLTQFRQKDHIKNYQSLYPQNTWQNHLNYINDWRNNNLYKDQTVNFNAFSDRYNKADHSTPRASAKAFYDQWERANDGTEQKRADYAEILYNWFNQEHLKETTNRINKNSNADFVQRLKLGHFQPSITTWDKPGYKSTHKLAYVTTDGPDVVFPIVQNIYGKLIDFSDPKNKDQDPYLSALLHNDTIHVRPGFGEYFTKNYKSQYTGFKSGGKINYLKFFK